MKALGQACKEARGDLDWLDINVHISKYQGRDARTLKAFEEGRQPDHLDAVLAGYAAAGDTTVLAICERAMEVLRQDPQTAGEGFERPLREAAREHHKARGGSARKRRASGK